MGKELPENVIKRLSEYRQLLSKYKYSIFPHINSVDLARILKTTQETVRRDLMLIGCQSKNVRKGYNVRELIERINETLDFEGNRITNVAIIGNSPPITELFLNDYSGDKLNIAGIFDFVISDKDQKSTDFEYYTLKDLPRVIEEKKITIAILNISSEYAGQVTEILLNSDIKGIINFSPVSLTVPEDVFLQEINIITLLEKAVYFQKNKENEI